MAKEEYQNELETLKSDIAQLRTDMGELMDSFRQMGQERVTEAKSKATSEVDHLREQLKQAYESASSSLSSNHAVHYRTHYCLFRPL